MRRLAGRKTHQDRMATVFRAFFKDLRIEKFRAGHHPIELHVHLWYVVVVAVVKEVNAMTASGTHSMSVSPQWRRLAWGCAAVAAVMIHAIHQATIKPITHAHAHARLLPGRA